VLRVAALAGAAPPIIVAGAAHVGLIRRQLRDLGQDGLILAEPQGRDSAPAIIAAALVIARTDPQGVALMVASDHHVPDIGAFAGGVTAALSAAEAGHIITFGIAPGGPSRAYGYIRPGDPVSPGAAVRRVGAFHEKPDEARARALIEEGGLWNSGNFLFRVDVMLAEAARLCPGLVEGVQAALSGGAESDGVLALGPAFGDCPKISIDFAVMEKTDRAAVIPVDYAWSDLGAWDAIWAASPQDGAGNAIKGRVAAVQTRNSLLRAEPGLEIVALGLRDLAVIAHDHRVLVYSLDRAADIKSAVDALGRLPPPPPGCAPGLGQTRQRLVKWLWSDALPTWWSFGADHVAGGFHDRLAWDLTPTDHPRRVRVQARQVFVYATAGLMGWPGPWATAVRHGLDWLEARHRRGDGLYRTQVTRDGAVRDDTANLYDQAFVLLAMAAAATALPDLRGPLTAKAHELAGRIVGVFARDQGGFRAAEGADAFESDPIMHLFEAAQAWRDVDSSLHWDALARDIATHFLARMMDRDRPQIRETFAADWSPRAEPAGRVIEPGHQFEWAWLLGRWGRQTGDARALAAAEGLYGTGLTGVDPDSGFVLDELTDEGASTGPSARLWPQAERLRAVMMFERDPEARREAVHAAARALESYFTTDPRGLWRDGRPDLHLSEDAAMASSFYHIIGAIRALDDQAEG